MPQMKQDKQMKRGDIDFHYSDTVMSRTWYDSYAVLILSSSNDGADGCYPVFFRMKGSATKASVSCPNVVKLFNNSKRGVDLIDQKTVLYRLDRKSELSQRIEVIAEMRDRTIKHLTFA